LVLYPGVNPYPAVSFVPRIKVFNWLFSRHKSFDLSSIYPMVGAPKDDSLKTLFLKYPPECLLHV
jgi:hypothetical protein